MSEDRGSSVTLGGTLRDQRHRVVTQLRNHFSFASLLAILFLTFLDNTVISAVLANVQSSLHSGISELQWIVGGYALAFASLMLICGSLGDNYGRKKIMLIGVAVFCSGSVICALSSSSTELIIGRVVMGIGAAGSEPGTLSMIRHIYPEHRRRARALGAWAAVSGLALALAKGETSGHVLKLVSMHADCDADSLLLLADPVGPTCHRGTDSCFGDAAAPALVFLGRLDALVARRERERPADSYTTRLFEGGLRRIAQKVGEEGVETSLAAVAEDDAALLGEAADLIYHLIVLLRARGLGLEAAVAVLAARHAKG